MRRLRRVVPFNDLNSCLPCRAAACRAAGDDGARGDPGEAPDSMPFAGMGADWREFRARLVAQERTTPGEEEAPDEPSSSAPAVKPKGGSGLWAHPIPGPEQGCLLVAHPLMFAANQTYFSQSVIFVFAHGESGTVGLILNKPTQFTLGGVQGAEVLCPEFEGEPLNLGGDVGRDTLHVLHPFRDLEGAQGVLNGVCVGGFKGAKEAVRSGEAAPGDFRWFTRYAGWAPGQLESECEQGVWFTAAAGRDVVLRPCEGDGRDMWHGVLELMGGDYADLSESVREGYREQGPAGGDDSKSEL